MNPLDKQIKLHKWKESYFSKSIIDRLEMSYIYLGYEEKELKRWEFKVNQEDEVEKRFPPFGESFGLSDHNEDWNFLMILYERVKNDTRFVDEKAEIYKYLMLPDKREFFIAITNPILRLITSYVQKRK